MTVTRERVTGTALQKAILKEALRQGWLCAHFPPVRTEMGWRVPVGAQGKGWPDIFLLRERALAIEVKGDGDRMRPDQVKWRNAFVLAGVQFVVATPAVWLDGTIDEILRARDYVPDGEGA